MQRRLLLSNSRNPGQEPLAHARGEIAEFLGSGVYEVTFVPYAGVVFSHAEYVTRMREEFAGLGLVSVTERADPRAAIRAAEAIVVGGGNSFRLLQLACELGLLEEIRARVRAGVPYLGWSAGANLACPTIRTTNDMPIVEPPSLSALGLVPFQINPHYTSDRLPNHQGESRDDRLAEFLTLKPAVTVVGLREGSMLQVEGETVLLSGPHSARIFRAGQEPFEAGPPAAGAPFSLLEALGQAAAR